MRHKVAATFGGTRASGFATVSILYLAPAGVLYLVASLRSAYYILCRLRRLLYLVPWSAYTYYILWLRLRRYYI